MISKSGNNGGTYAISDIALEFASWLSPEFNLYVIQEFQRLKKEESYNNKLDWHIGRLLSKINYEIQTNAINNYLVPTLTEKQKRFIYAEEADLINVALFGMTAKEWKEKNVELSKKGNIRDYTDLIHLVILNNLENINSELIKLNKTQRERIIELNNIARKQMEIIKNNYSYKQLDDSLHLKIDTL